MEADELVLTNSPNLSSNSMPSIDYNSEEMLRVNWRTPMRKSEPIRGKFVQLNEQHQGGPTHSE